MSSHDVSYKTMRKNFDGSATSLVLSEALQDFLHGHEWKQSIEMFVRANCEKFCDVEDYSHEHYEIWKASWSTRL